jgi:hypothetical protein
LRRVAWFAAALAAACGSPANPEAGPLDQIYRPTGLAVHRTGAGARLLVASSNADLRYDVDTGGSVLALDPSADPAVLRGAVNISSFAGELVVARNVDPASPEGQLDPATACSTLPAPLALTAMRGSNMLAALRIGASGELACDDRCDVPLSGPFADPLAVAVACGGGRERAFVAYLRSVSGTGWLSEYDLVTGAVQNVAVGVSAIRSLTYDAANDRLYLMGFATSVQTPLRWIELRGCTLGAPPASGGCSIGQASLPEVVGAVELRSMALAHPFGTAPQRAFLTGRRYDPASAATFGTRTTDLGGVLLVVDLVENGLGGVDLQLVNEIDIGRGAQDVRVLPQRPGQRDLVAALCVDAGQLWIYDDDTGHRHPFGLNPDTGAPVLGSQPYGLAVDPEAIGTARVYVGSFGESFVTPVEVPLDAPWDAAIVTTGGAPRRITGGTP